MTATIQKTIEHESREANLQAAKKAVRMYRGSSLQRHTDLGAIAEAMYGCEYRLLKKKYGENHYNYIQYPERIQKEARAIQDYRFELNVNI